MNKCSSYCLRFLKRKNTVQTNMKVIMQPVLSVKIETVGWEFKGSKRFTLGNHKGFHMELERWIGFQKLIS